MKIILLIVFAVVQQFVYSQKTDTTRKYLDASLTLTSRNKAVFSAISFKSNDHWLLQATYPNNDPLIHASFRDEKLTVLDGLFTCFYANKIPAAYGQYKNGYRAGVWKFWHKNGQLRDSGILMNNKQVDTWHTWYEDGKLLLVVDFAPDDLSSPGADVNISSTQKKSLVQSTEFTGLKHGRFLRYYSNGMLSDSGRYINDKKNGLWKVWFENGQLEGIGNFSNDSLQGEWIWYRDNGAVATKENYRDNKLVSLQCFDDKGNYTGDYCSVLKPPVPLGSFTDFDNYLLDNIILPSDLKTIRLEGTVTITCVITKEGKLTGIDIMGCPYESLKKEIEKFFLSIKEWSPAILHNRPTDYLFKYVLPLSQPAVDD